MAKKKPVPANVLELPVEYGQVSIGDKTTRIGVNVDRSELKVSDADKQLCEKRLTGRIITRPPGNPEQGTLPGVDLETHLAGVFDVKGFSVTSDKISFGLTFALASIDVSVLAHFAKRSGRLIVEAVEALPESNGEAEEDEE